MAKFYLMGNYTAKAFQGFVANPDTDRAAAINSVANSIGGKVLGYDIVRGSFDFIVIITPIFFNTKISFLIIFGFNYILVF